MRYARIKISWKFSGREGRPSEAFHFIGSNWLEGELPFHLHKISTKTTTTQTTTTTTNNNCSEIGDSGKNLLPYSYGKWLSANQSRPSSTFFFFHFVQSVRIKLFMHADLQGTFFAYDCRMRCLLLAPCKGRIQLA